ncbi:MAG: hypothetical protein KAS81_06035, partial [Anaerolineales bacterium]|nr:hypothetical protein [Anaerolineales bacterium]
AFLRGRQVATGGWASDISSDTTCFRDRVKGLGGVCRARRALHTPPACLFWAASRRKMTIVRTLV